MLAVIVPAHDEEEHIGTCLRSLGKASRCPRLDGEPVLIVVALDSCTDHTRALVLRWKARSVEVSARNVGVARAAGARLALACGARWLAFTDADSAVAPDWLAEQL
jgi:glycosyltransferase involved in cell wall biosynthesis